MKKRYLLLLGVIAILLILAIVGKSTGFLSTTYATSDSGVTYKCGYYYSSAARSITYFEPIKAQCEAEGFICDLYDQNSLTIFTCQQLCYDCNEPEDFFIAAISPDCDGDSYYSAWGTALDVNDAKNYYAGSISNAQLYDKYCNVPTTVTCFQCDGSSLATKDFEDSCGNGWTENWQSLNCEEPAPNTVDCYQCDGADLKSQTFENSCDSGWSTSVPTCEADTITCYSCDQQTNVEQSQIFTETTCPGTLSPTHLNCNVETTDCYQCVGGVVSTNTFSGATCEAGWTEYLNAEDIPKCSGVIGLVDKYIDFKNKPLQSGFLIGAIIMLLYVLIITVKDLSSKDSGREGF